MSCNERKASIESQNALKGKDGFALLAALTLTMVATAAVLGYTSFCSNELNATRRTLDYQKAKLVAEAGLEYGVLQLRDVMLKYQFELSSTLLQFELDTVTPPTDVGTYHYVTPDGDVAFKITAESDPVADIITEGTACLDQFGKFQYFTVTCGALNTNSGVGAVAKQTLQAVSVFMIRYGVFYNPDLEILPGPPMWFTGPVHANGDIYVDANSGPVHFSDRITAHGDIYHHRKDELVRKGTVLIEDGVGVEYAMEDAGLVIDSHHPDWMPMAVARWDGRVLSSSHGVPSLDPPISPVDDPHILIEQADPEALFDDASEPEKFANKAGLFIHVDSNGVFTATNFFGNDVTEYFTNALLVVNGTANGKKKHKKNGSSQYYSYQMETNGAFDLTTVQLWDDREDTEVALLDIYVDQLLTQYPDITDPLKHSPDEGLGIVYATIQDPDPSDPDVMPAVRIRNGSDLPDCGLSIVTDQPLYVEGHYNVADDPPMPALVAGDAVTFLSRDWQDANSKGASGLSGRMAKNTTYKTVVMTGNEPTYIGDYNGGLENVLRFLEKWTGKTVSFRGSIICLWTAQVADANWSYGQYYTAPNRDWGYDEIYKSAAPPGMTRVFGLEETAWSMETWDSVSFD